MMTKKNGRKKDVKSLEDVFFQFVYRQYFQEWKKTLEEIESELLNVK